jgi:hypothetical protein
MLVRAIGTLGFNMFSTVRAAKEEAISSQPQRRTLPGFSAILSREIPKKRILSAGLPRPV